MLKMVKTHILRNHQKKVLLFMTFGRVINIFSSSLRFAKWQFTQARYKKVTNLFLKCLKFSLFGKGKHVIFFFFEIVAHVTK